MSRHNSPFANVRSMPRPAWFLFGGALLNRFGTFVMPFLVLYLTQRGFSPAEAALAVSAYGGGHVVASLAGGYLSDRIGRRDTIAYSMIASAAAMLALSQAHSYWLIVAITFCAGAAAEMYRPASGALLGDLVGPDCRVTAFALLRLANNIGFAAGPATAGFLASKSFVLVFVGDAASSIAFALLALAALPRLTHRREDEQPVRGGFANAFRNAPFITFVLATLCITWIEYQIVSTLPLRVRELGHSASVFGILISANGLLVALFELALTALTQRFVPQLVIALGMALFAGGFALAGAVATVPALLLAVAVWTFGEMIFMPVTGAYLTSLSPPHFRGTYNGIWLSTWSVGMLFGPYLGTLLFVSRPHAYWILVAAAGAAGALLMLASARRDRRDPQTEPLLTD